jgi:uncharacterized protein (DUF433 family)
MESGILWATDGHQEGKRFDVSLGRAYASRKEPARMTSLDRITSDAGRMNGQPCVRNLRLTVRRVLEALATYPDRADLLREYPELDAEDIRQVLAYAATALDDKVIDLPKSA